MKFRVYRRTDGLFEWHAKAVNGRIVATSGGQGYTSRYGAWRAADTFVIGIICGVTREDA